MTTGFLIKNLKDYTIEIVPSNYDLIVNNVCKMMDVGMEVQQCEYDKDKVQEVKNSTYLRGFKYKDGLYDELISEYETIMREKGKFETLKKW